MADSALDQTTLEESFFFCEYAKRRFEMSKYNDGQIESIIKSIDFISRQILEGEIKEGMIIDLLSDAIYYHESTIMGLMPIVSFKGLEKYIACISAKYQIELLLHISNIFKVNSAFLPFPCDMAEVTMRAKSGEQIPTTFKNLDRYDKRCVIIFHEDTDYVFFGIDKNLSSDETIKILKEKATVFKSINNYENCKQNDTLKDIHKQSKSGSYRQSLNNFFYKSTGLLIYDLYIANNYNLDSAFTEHRRHDPQTKCDPSKNPTSEDCSMCKYFSSCAGLWRKQFNSAVKKICGALSPEDWLKHAKETRLKQMLTRRPVKFFEYEFKGTIPTM